MIKLLLETGKIEVDLKDKDGRTPLLWVAGEGHEAVIKLLLGTGKVGVDLKDSLGRTLLSREVERKYERRDQAIMNDRSSEGRGSRPINLPASILNTLRFLFHDHIPPHITSHAV